ncbi:heat shock protein HtpX [Candidatus Rickettsiella viridis]|uniref:Protease HtpX n=1 Tax=Candidatus Rickettsiella viridis TaxID=676208 RepID=A0A2Z5V7N6_9COXI|nr:protease HtpX [Candidatus Rickettsiella viridis]BBB15657.1 heat shock protein HtpX [Candidatus Rickettsiella viridis]
MFKRVLLFLATNILIIITISIITNLLGLHSYLTSQGIDYRSLAIFCAIWGTAGAFISLFMSKFIAKKSMGVNVIDPNATKTEEEQNILEIVHGLARKAGLKTLPEVGIYQSPELNAFATGPTKNNSLVAVSSGLLQRMNREEIEGVLGHEISHVTNGDMVTMTLIQGIVNAFALFLSRLVAYVISAGTTANQNTDQQPVAGSGGPMFYMLTTVFDVLFTLFGSILVAAFSRYREYRADRGGANLSGRERMISALQALQRNMQPEDTRAPSLSTLKISHKSIGFRALFSSHPPLELRIARLQKTK